MAKSKVLRPELEMYARDTPALFGSLTVYLAGQKADFLRGRFVAANWDVEELERHKEEIVADGLLKNQPFKGDIGKGGHFSSHESGLVSARASGPTVSTGDPGTTLYHRGPRGVIGGNAFCGA